MPLDIHNDRILILDFGSQYTQLIGRCIRDIGVYCEIVPYDVNDITILDFKPKGIILSGGPESIHKRHSPKASRIIFDIGVPLLGICYGMQFMAEQLGGKVLTSNFHEFGHTRVNLTGSNPLSDGIGIIPDRNNEFTLDVWMSHGDQVTQLPETFEVFASTPNCPIAGIFDKKSNYYGIQFHPEVTHTKKGKEILSQFSLKICQCNPFWTPPKIAEDIVNKVRAKVGKNNVLLGLSGGVDSSVTAALLHKAIGSQLTCIFVNNGLLRLHEPNEVMNMFSKNMGLTVLYIDAIDEFIVNLTGKKDPEEKRKIIGETFVKVFEREAKKLENIKYLAQGTVYPDVIESAQLANSKAHVIKSHHNVGGLPKNMTLQLIEPLRSLFKDEVRSLGLELSLPYDMLYRHPFPGPGLAVRILGEVKKEYVEILRLADNIFMEELRISNWYYKVSQAFAVFQGVKSVGVVGDRRRYAWVISLRTVETIDFMTASWGRLPYDLLESISNRIINEIKSVSRVTYDISSKPPATIEWE